MNLNETLQLLHALRASGATHFKSQDFEVQMDKWKSDGPVQSPGLDLKQTPSFPLTNPPENVEATEKLKDLIETMKMDDAQLIDKIFPAGAGG